ncbi:hypothetical protein QZH41_015519, partial [Actinostola sp. cb2023]
MDMLQWKKAACCFVFLNLLDESEEKRHWKRGKTRQWIRRREEKGLYNVVRELQVEDTVGFKEMMRMDRETFTTILTAIEPEIAKFQIQGGHKVISSAERLTLALRFLATGETFASLHFQFRMGKATISYIIREVCHAIYKILGPKFMAVPSTPQEWSVIADEFERKWQYPNCIGAVDGKHVVIRPPPASGSHYFNYKHTHSIVLMAVAGPNYECIYADVGTNGRVSDGGVWNKCSLLKKLEIGGMGVPEDKPLPFGKDPMPHVLVGDDAFALRPFIMKPYPQRNLMVENRIYNYRHSRARRLSENLFGIVANRWRVFLTVMALSPSYVEDIIMAALTLHNLLRSTTNSSRQ